MTMQRRHFELIAETLASCDVRYASYALWESLCNDFATRLASTNLNFNRARFLRACGVED